MIHVHSNRGKSGFTLIEVLLVITLMLVLAAISLPVLSNTFTNYRLKKSADILRTEWTNLRLEAMEKGEIFCFRCTIGGNQILIDKVLDVHFAAAQRLDREFGSARREPLEGTPEFYEGDTLYEQGFSGSDEDFILRDPSSATPETGARFITLPEKVFFSDALAVPDERAAYYLGFTVGEDENAVLDDPVVNRDTRFGETKSHDGRLWSVPIFFFPDGTTSTAAVLLKNRINRCLEVRLRSLTGTATVGSLVFPENYVGELDPGTLEQDHANP